MKDKIEGLRILKGKIKNHVVVVKIIIPNLDTFQDDTTVSHSLEFLRELRVLCELSHPNILPLYGYTFNPLARIFKIPKADCQEPFPAIQKDDNTDKSNLLSLYFVLFEKRQGFPWKKRIRVVICVLQALIYLLGDMDPGRSCVIHRYFYFYYYLVCVLLYMLYFP
jgi:serine/threonine protein kinase